MTDHLPDWRVPPYLIPQEKEELVAQLRDLPNLDGRKFYSSGPAGEDTVFQGDGFLQFTFIDLLSSATKIGKAFVISNTCDLSPENERVLPINLMYAPLAPLRGFESALRTQQSGKADSVLSAIRKNQYTHILYLPEIPGQLDESIVRLDMVHNIPPTFLYSKDDWKSLRLFSLSNFGIYTTILKLSIHFHRLQEGVSRSHRV